VSDQWQTVDKLLDVLISGYRDMPREGDDRESDLRHFAAALSRVASPQSIGPLLIVAIARLANEVDA
jgi:hypothetical protein